MLYRIRFSKGTRNCGPDPAVQGFCIETGRLTQQPLPQFSNWNLTHGVDDRAVNPVNGRDDAIAELWRSGGSTTQIVDL